MNLKEFKSEIRKIILEELRAQLPIIIESVVTSIQKTTPPPRQSPQVHAPAKKTLEQLLKENESEEEEIQKPQGSLKKYSNNPVLNAILNETTNDLRSRDRMSGSGVSIVGLTEPFEKLTSVTDSDVIVENEIPEQSFSVPTETAASSAGTVDSVVDIKDKLPPFLSKMFSRERNKAILEKSKEINS